MRRKELTRYGGGWDWQGMDAGCWMLDAECWTLDAMLRVGCWVLGVVLGAGCWVLDAGC